MKALLATLSYAFHRKIRLLMALHFTGEYLRRRNTISGSQRERIVVVVHVIGHLFRRDDAGEFHVQQVSPSSLGAFPRPSKRASCCAFPFACLLMFRWGFPLSSSASHLLSEDGY